MKRFIFLALVLLALPVSATEWSHIDALSILEFGIGASGSETTIIDTSGNFTFPGTLAIADDNDLTFGSVFSLEWTTADPNANCILLDLPTGGSVDVPVVMIASADSDFGYFNSVVEPTLAVENLAGSSYVALDFSGTTLAELKTGGSATQLSITSPILINTGSTSITDYTPSRVIGYNSGASMTIAVSDTTGDVAITHAGSNKAVTWTAVGGFDLVGSIALDAITQVGNVSMDGATMLFDGSTSVRGVSAGFTSLESPANRFGVNATEYMQIATVATTGATTITHTGTMPTVTWTANSFDFIGTMALDATTLSDVLTFSDGDTIDNTAPDTLTITETNIDLVGALAADALTLSDVLTFSDGGTIDNTAADTLTVTETNIALTGALLFTGASIQTGSLAQAGGTVTVGADGTAYDVTFYSDSAGDMMVWGDTEYLDISVPAGQDAIEVIDGNVEIQDQFGLELTGATTSTWDPASMNDGDVQTKSVTITGAALGDFVLLSAPYDLQLITATGYVQATNTIYILLDNESGGTVDLGSGDWKVIVIPSTD